MTTLRNAAKAVLRAYTKMQFLPWAIGEALNPPMAALHAALAQEEQAESDAKAYATQMAIAIWRKHYQQAAPQWRPLDDLMGVLSQIDNMTSGLQLAQQAEPVRKPLTIQEINALPSVKDRWFPAAMNDTIMKIIRDVERAHGIGGQDGQA